VRLSHAPARTRVTFDDLALVAHAGLAPVTGLAERAGLHQLIAELVRPVAGPPGDGGMNHGRRVSERVTACR
jgi:hypothetical protein